MQGRAPKPRGGVRKIERRARRDGCGERGVEDEEAGEEEWKSVCVNLEQGLCRLPPRGIRIEGSLQHLDELCHGHLPASGMWIHRRGGGSSHGCFRRRRKQRGAVALYT